MAWAEPEYSRTEVDLAGEALIARAAPMSPDFDHTLDVIGNWRSSHAFPLNTFQVGLRGKIRLVDRHGLVAQRVKRLTAIQAKLRRFGWLALSEMQDIGGCRAVVSDVRGVDNLASLYRSSSLKHKLVKVDDYIRDPKVSGYRGIHLIYSYHSDRKTTYNALKIELQFRSTLQHAWATAVETVGTFIQQALKSSQGEADWLRLFSLMGNFIALREDAPLVPGTPSDPVQLRRELRELASKLDVESRLVAYGDALRFLQDRPLKGARFYLLLLDARAQSLTGSGYKPNEMEQASADYLAAERSLSQTPGVDVVLVSVESLDALRRAYPNYFADTRLFLTELRSAMSSDAIKPRGRPLRRSTSAPGRPGRAQ